jgi:hypothetical protein
MAPSHSAVKNYFKYFGVGGLARRGRSGASVKGVRKAEVLKTKIEKIGSFCGRNRKI